MENNNFEWFMVGLSIGIFIVSITWVLTILF